MEKIIRQSVGIDVSLKTLDVTFGKMSESMDIYYLFQCSFKNTEAGFMKLLQFMNDKMDSSISVRFVMEATGVYHEKLAYFLHGKGHSLSIVLPNKINSYMRTLTIKTVNDKTCSEAIARFGLERKLDDWNPPKESYKKLRQLTRERDQLVSERAALKNQLHAEEREAYPLLKTINRLKQRIKFLNKQESEIKADIERVVCKSPDLDDEIKYMTSVPGVGRLTAVILLAETNGFELIRNKKQLASYAGLDVKERQSGTSIRGVSKISKRGNKHIRKAMYLPALTSVRSNKINRDIYTRIVQKHGIKKKAIIAIERRLLELCFILFRNKTFFNPAFEEKNSTQLKLCAIQANL
ncbi:IS110 family transposase [Fluviicola chungangensis]|uniref:IS110 family transposase n=1 Tax=Fluviicola chungangensis TaxID=2597671 RepID=A0A556MQ54_9FLAO|nr:IS110 family transposase [Fluviicola chungangensis]TSJ42036.1 IS110 family transposase [Fluviicola chungangensis]